MHAHRDATRRLALTALALTLSACPTSRSTQRPRAEAGFTGCLPLTGTSRVGLRLGPDGRYLYWIEQVRMHGFEDAWPSNEVVRWPLAGGPVERLTSAIETPYRVLTDGRLVGARKDAGVALWSPAGAELVSFSGTVDELEVMPGDQVLVYRMGASIWRQPIHREGARWLAYAENLLGVDGATVIIRNRGELFRVDVATGAQTPLPALEGVVKAFPGGLVVQTTAGVGLRPLAGGATQTVLPGEDWEVRLAPDGVRAWRKVGPRLEGSIVPEGAVGGGTSGASARGPTEAGAITGVDRFPPVLGGDSLEGFVRLPDGRVAYLVGHDLDGDDQVTTGDEVDVCLAPARIAEVRVPPRSAPERWREAAAIITKAVDERLGGGTWHFTAGDAVPGVMVETKTVRRDRAAMWDDTRALAATTGQATGDPTLSIDITYGDGKRSYSEWWSAAGRRVAWAGVGGATVPDLADYDALVTVTKLAASDAGDDEDEDDAERDDDDPGPPLARCTGEVTNRTDHRLVALVADCVSGIDDEPIEVSPPDLAPGQTGRFDGVVRQATDTELAVSIHSGSGRDEVPSFSTTRHARYLALAAGAAETLDRTRLIYRTTSNDVGATTVFLTAPDDFARWSEQNRDKAASTALEIFDKLDREVLDGKRGDDLRLQLTAGEDGWGYHDGTLTRD